METQAPARGKQTQGFGHLAQGLSAISNRLLAFNLVYYAAALALAFGSIALFFAHPAWYTFLLAFVLVSSRQQALLNCEHECAHRKFVRGRRANDLMGTWATGAPVGSPFGVARANHLAHHRLLATPEDPDRVLHDAEPPRDTRWGLVGYFARGLFAAYALMVLFDRPAGDTASATKRSDAVAILAVQAVLFGSMTLAFAWWAYFALWIAPLITLTTLSHLVRSYAEHSVTLAEQPGHANRLITIRSNLIERSIVAPYWMNLHAEHHLLPSVPAPRLRALRTLLREQDGLPPVLERSSYRAAVHTSLRSLDRR